MQAPVDRVPTVSEYVTDSNEVWQTTRDHESDAGTVTGEDRMELGLPHADVGFYQRIEARVEAKRPSTGRVDQRSWFEIDDGNDIIRVESTTRTSRDAATVHLLAAEDDATVFEETWRWNRER